MAKLRRCALRFPQQYASELGFERFGGRPTQGCPRVSVYAPDTPSVTRDGAWGMFRAPQRCLWPDASAVDPHRAISSAATWADLAVFLKSWRGIQYRYAARLQALTRTLVMVWMIPPRPRMARVPLAAPLVSAFTQVVE